MSSKKELELELNKLPPRPYKPTADLRSLHNLFHKAAEIDEGVPCHVQTLETKADILAFANSMGPTNLGQALKLADDIRQEVVNNGYPEGSGLVLKLALRIYRDHNPPGKVEHNY